MAGQETYLIQLGHADDRGVILQPWRGRRWWRLGLNTRLSAAFDEMRSEISVAKPALSKFSVRRIALGLVLGHCIRSAVPSRSLRALVRRALALGRRRWFRFVFLHHSLV